MVSRQCSGLEGIGLILAFLSIYLWLFRSTRFPAALALLPLGAVAVWSLNAVRIAGLIVIGSSGWPDVALGGFHSQAGWLAFNGVGLGVAAMTLHSGWFAATVTHRRSDAAAVCGDLTPAIASLFMAMLAAGMVTGGMSRTFEWLYPFRLLAVMAVLWFFRRSYGALSWRLSLPAATIGISWAGYGLHLRRRRSMTRASGLSRWHRSLCRLLRRGSSLVCWGSSFSCPSSKSWHSGDS